MKISLILLGVIGLSSVSHAYIAACLEKGEKKLPIYIDVLNNNKCIGGFSFEVRKNGLLTAQGCVNPKLVVAGKGTYRGCLSVNEFGNVTVTDMEPIWAE